MSLHASRSRRFLEGWDKNLAETEIPDFLTEVTIDHLKIPESGSADGSFGCVGHSHPAKPTKE
jgi:hypothetical protein